jgi:hypothetical protein
MRKFVNVFAVAAGALLVASVAAAATDLVCTGPSSGGTWHNVLVPSGMSCTLDDTRVTGNVTVQAGGSFQVNTNSGMDTTIAGDIKGDGCDSIDLESTGLSGRIVVGGNVTIQNCTSNSFVGGRGSSFCPPNPPESLFIGGNVKCNNNPGGCVYDYTTIGGNFECSGNFACTLQTDAIGKNVTMNNNSSNGVSVDNTSIAGDVKCSGNSSVSGSGNTIAGNKSGQCTGL